MSSQTQSSKALNVSKWVVASVLLAAIGYANSFYGADYPLLYRFIVVTIGVLIGLGIAASTTQGRAFIALAREARVEMKKVVWPSKNETLMTSGFVVLVVIFFSLVLWAVDSVLSYLVALVIG